MTLGRIRKFLGCDEDATIEQLLAKWKKLVVLARHAGDTQREIKLNACKAELIKKKRSHGTKCPSCGVRIHYDSTSCIMCYHASRHTKKLTFRHGARRESATGLNPT